MASDGLRGSPGAGTPFGRTPGRLEPPPGFTDPPPGLLILEFPGPNGSMLGVPSLRADSHPVPSAKATPATDRATARPVRGWSARDGAAKDLEEDARWVLLSPIILKYLWWAGDRCALSHSHSGPRHGRLREVRDSETRWREARLDSLRVIENPSSQRVLV